MDEKFIRQYPSEPCASVQGSTGFEQAETDYADCRAARCIGIVRPGSNPSDRQSAAWGDITLEAETKDLKFVSTLAEGIEIPYGTRLEGKFTMAGTKMARDLLLMQP